MSPLSPPCLLCLNCLIPCTCPQPLLSRYCLMSYTCVSPLYIVSVFPLPPVGLSSIVLVPSFSCRPVRIPGSACLTLPALNLDSLPAPFWTLLFLAPFLLFILSPASFSAPEPQPVTGT
ncbi:hypothetical protein EYF80_006112 [Liparis tanakae]|uniref:Uncharacterized protein n=1 Tax=Liparis tanakae TaxID=230148 RepID=A0A4Z2J192_9TELE|nr:hypothetical protein EYF80_006112 [Liparis tanakae]